MLLARPTQFALVAAMILTITGRAMATYEDRMLIEDIKAVEMERQQLKAQLAAARKAEANARIANDHWTQARDGLAKMRTSYRRRSDPKLFLRLNHQVTECNRLRDHVIELQTTRDREIAKLDGMAKALAAHNARHNQRVAELRAERDVSPAVDLTDAWEGLIRAAGIKATPPPAKPSPVP